MYFKTAILLAALVVPASSHGGSLHVDPKDEHVKEHVQAHLDEIADDAKIQTEEDVYFGYFKLHDTDADGFMDGLELLRSFADHRSRKMDALYTDAEYNKDLASYTEIVDMTLKDFDKNDDGLISLAEYINKVKGSS